MAQWRAPREGADYLKGSSVRILPSPPERAARLGGRYLTHLTGNGRP